MIMTRLGVDTGGTFTDFVWLDENGRIHIHKQLSTPHDPAEAILSGIDHLAIPPAAEVVHGSTVATNALLERRGARTALITTAGFTDVLAIGRQNRPDLYALVPQKPPPLVPRPWRFGLHERVTAQGEVLTPLNLAELDPILAQLDADRIESVAVCLLFSFLHPDHERAIGDYLRQGRPNLHVSLSSDILPEYREYERTATTVINAYVAPLMAHYLQRLRRGVAPRRLTIMQSNGGVISAETAGTQAARTALSGPAGGVVGARFVALQAAQQAGQGKFDQLITFDMGGTSTDVALCPGRLPTTAEGEIAGLPLRLPIIDIHTVGAGGGSLAYVDAGGALHVGPQSAGADPGPACYGRSSTDPPQPTVTDANLLLGRLDADHFLGGTMRLEETAARQALTDLAQTMQVASPELAAWGVIALANAHMERAIRRISVERGHDPRHFTLVAFGGAGPLHAAELAQQLQIPRVLIPAVPGVLSALGMLVAAPTKDYSQTVLHEVGEDDTAVSLWLRACFTPLEERAYADMAAEGHATQNVTLHHHLDMRYLGQSHELTVEVNCQEREGRQENEATLMALFHVAHERRYGYRQPQAEVEVVTVRVTAVATVTGVRYSVISNPSTDPGSPNAKRSRSDITDYGLPLTHKPVWFEQRPWNTPLFDRESLRPGMILPAPALVVQYDTTTVIPPGWETAVDRYGNLILEYDHNLATIGLRHSPKNKKAE
jgi:N-methylhydantoinase A